MEHDDRNKEKKKPLDDKQRDYFRALLNERISFICRLAALIIAVIAFTSTIIGRGNLDYVILGLCLCIALLAIAGMQNHGKR